MVALGLLAGLVLGSAALVVDRLTGLVFSLDELQAQLPCPLLKHLPALSRVMPPACWRQGPWPPHPATAPSPWCPWVRCPPIG